jgi:predicted dehydrogenase
VVGNLHIAETRPERLAEVAKATGAKTATSDYRELLKIKEIDAYMISATPETLHYPMARECLLAGKHVFLEKPIAIELHEADELIALAAQTKL